MIPLENYQFHHLFDGYATLVHLHFDNGRVTVAHCQIESEAYKATMKNTKLCYNEFSKSQPKPQNFLSHIGKLENLFSDTSLTDNNNTGVIHLGDGYVICLTETVKGSIEIDPETLKMIGRFKYNDSLCGLIHSAHPMVIETELLTVLPDLMKCGCRVVKMKAGTNKRKMIGRVNCRGVPAPGCVHSFPVTENYISVLEMPLRYNAQNLLRANRTPLFKFERHP